MTLESQLRSCGPFEEHFGLRMPAGTSGFDQQEPLGAL
jgi:hypothetical protein